MDWPQIVDVACPMCGGRKGPSIGSLAQSLAKYGLAFGWDTEVICCADCGSYYQQRRPEHLLCLYGRKNTYEKKFIDSVESREVAVVRVARLREYRPGPGSVLDVGAGAGHFARAAAEHYAPVTAMEVSPSLCEYMRDRGGHEVVEGDFFGPAAPAPESCDVLTGFDIFEHLDDPGLLVRRARQALRPGGLLVLCTQDPEHFDILADLSNYAEHFLAPSRRAVEEMLAREGFRPLGWHHDESPVRSPHKDPKYLITYFAERN